MASPGFSKPLGEFRACLPDLKNPQLTKMREQTCREYARDFKTLKHPPWLYELYEHWRVLYQEPFKGVTSNGKLRQDLFMLQDEDVPIEDIVQTAQRFLSQITQDQREMVSYHIDSPEWRTWSNPEFLLADKGLRLEDVSPEVRHSILRILAATLSPEGYEKAIAAMHINHFLGELVDGLNIMNQHSYNFVLFGQPSSRRPWGFSFYGHHLCLNIFLYMRQIVISPWFTGAEPNEIDDGPWSGTTVLRSEEAAGLKLMQSLHPEMQKRAQIYKLMKDPAMPRGRWNHDDQRHLCGAYRDNRVVPYEGITASELNSEQKALLFSIIEEYLLYLPAKSRAMRLDNIKAFEKETYFSWIGGFSDTDSFYYRIQSPVVIAEFDHHSGVFLTNEQPKKFHIHTCFRTPNGGDYGMALRPLIPSIE